MDCTFTLASAAADIGVNIGKLRVEVLDCMSIRALCRGDYGACAEMTRVGLRFVQKQAGSNSLAERRSDRFSARLWILRSLAYLGMGKAVKLYFSNLLDCLDCLCVLGDAGCPYLAEL